MIRALIFLALWAALPSPGQVVSVALYTSFQHQPSPAVVQALHEEVDFLLAPSGFRFEWRSLPANEQKSANDLAVITFTGRCEVLPMASNSHLDNRLAWTYISDGIVLPFADVDCDAVRAYLLKNLFVLPSEDRAKVYGRATGRVMAHELLHIFAKTAHHSAHGVDQPAFSVAELLADRLVFDDREPNIPVLLVSRTAASRAVAGSPQNGRDLYIRNGCSSCHGAEGEGTRRGPRLREYGRVSTAVILAAKLAKSGTKMCRRARDLKVAAPSVAEEDLPDLVSFFNDVHR
jgi:cytochrome c553